ncbi:hypothetical protein PSH28_09045 [Pseudomonas resinovorans]|uniref:hypothetical protein n=1 Tax=Metapseudomonas resinovorans TaxID=53412 RepID=UPI00237F95F7|nr:hypothetical protein [Pseudomonas resinovorans]MDE3736736.1 hypothetical protein [Pseudomonas resinovorans]
MKCLIAPFLFLAAGITALPPMTASAQTALPDSCTKDKKGKYGKEFEIPCKALDDFLTTFNSKNEFAWAKTLNYPHVRMSGNQVTIWQTPEEYAKDQDLQKLAETIGWRNSRWNYRYVVQSGSDGKSNQVKYHVALSFTRLDEDGKPIPGHTFDSLYIITNTDGHWGTQFRSSMAGSLHGNSAY